MKNRIQLLLISVMLMLPLVSVAAADAVKQVQPAQPVQPIVATPQKSAAKTEPTSWLVGFNKGAVQQAEKKQVGSGAGRLLLGLMTVIGLIFGLAFMIKKMGYAGIAGGNQLKVVSVLSVGNKEKLMVVKVHGKYLLLGVTAHSVNKIDELQEEDIEDTTPHDTKKFSDYIKEATSAFTKKS